MPPRPPRSKSRDKARLDPDIPRINAAANGVQPPNERGTRAGSDFHWIVKAWAFEGLGVGDPGMTRTCDLRFRKPSLYPAELRDRRPAKVRGGLAAKYQSGRIIASPRVV